MTKPKYLIQSRHINVGIGIAVQRYLVFRDNLLIGTLLTKKDAVRYLKEFKSSARGILNGQ